MKQYTIFKCEHCRKESKDAKEILTCEASHIGNGLTFEEYETYRTLKGLCQAAGAKVGRTKNRETEKIFDDAIDKLVEFERNHGIIE